jgi:GNAT superfamily N-acetyltransferase
MENKVIIRKATLEDLKIIQELNHKLFILEKEEFDDTLITDWPLSTYGEEYFKTAIENDIVLVSIIDDKIVGYIVGSLNTEGTYNNMKQAELNNMYVCEEYRSIGIGTKLFNQLKTICIQNDIQEIKVVADYKNIKGINFYKNNGFEEAEITLKQKL